MKHNLPKHRWARIVAVALAGATAAALGCSLFVEFDESRIPATDAGAEAATDTAPPTETGGDTAVDDTAVDDTGLDDTGAPAEAGDTATTETVAPMDTSTTMETSVTDTGTDTGVEPDTAVPEVEPADAADAD